MRIPSSASAVALRLVGSGSALVALTCACAGTETGNPPSARSVSIALLLQSTGSSAAEEEEEESDEDLPYQAIDSAWLATESLDLLGCVGGDGTRLPTLVWDLVHPVAQPAQTEIPEFCGVDLRTRPVDIAAAGIPAEMAGASLWIRARRTDGTPVEVRSESSLDVSRSSGVPLFDPRLTLVFDAAAWLRGVNLDILSPDADGVVRLSSTSNAALLQAVERQIPDGSVLRTREVSDDALDD